MKKLKAKDFTRVKHTNCCDGCWFHESLGGCIEQDEPFNPIKLAEETWELLGNCGTLRDGFVFKLKDNGTSDS